MTGRFNRGSILRFYTRRAARILRRVVSGGWLLRCLADLRLFPVLVLLFLTVAPVQAQCPQVVWSDEFSGTSLDLGKWEPQIGDGCDINLCGWGNNELQWYKAENATVSDGTLKITAKKERVRSRQYTSARLRTKNLGDFTYGRFEARIKLPEGQGLWPAFWMLPTDEVYGGWPQSGEIDILETKGQSTNVIYGTIHFGDPWPNNRFTGESFLNRFGKFSQDFHVFALEWEPGEIRWYVDDTHSSTKTVDDLRGHSWPFDQRFHLLLNMAVGGTFVGNPDDSIFPRSLEVDYVRVYDKARPSLQGPFRVPPNAQGTVYSVSHESGTGSNYSWTVPPGATLVSGQGTSSIQVDWGTSGGVVSVHLVNSCTDTVLQMPVFVEPEEARESVFEDFEANRNLTYLSSTGSLNDADSNPDPSSSINSSAVVGEYLRNSAEKWDTLIYGVTGIPDAAPYVAGTKRFYMDVYSSAPPGRQITLQLENSAVATESNFPNGRHSAYLAKTTRQNQWERLAFDFDGRLDGNTPDTAVDNLVILFDGGWNSGDLYHFDNLDRYGPSSPGGCQPSSLHVNSIVPGTVNAGQGSKKGKAEVTIVDNCGAVVSGASVTGTFSGSFNETVTASTGSNGVAVLLTSSTVKGGVSFTFCVDSVGHASLPYNPADNVETCDGL